MAETRNAIRFLLNDEKVELTQLRPDTTLLDFLRLEKRLRGSKEGCAEGDCGACTVLIGRLKGEELVYETVTSCIRMVGSLDGCHVVTIEHLKGRDGSLHPVQKAMAELHGSQCGFCTPGFVMAIYAMWMSHPDPTVDDIERALQGNLCRCTGYSPILRAGLSGADYWVPEQDKLIKERDSIIATLKAMADGARVEVSDGDQRIIVPASVDDLADVLVSNENATIVAGSTDVGLWVTKFMRHITPAVFIGHIPELHRIEGGADGLTLGAVATYTEALPVIEKRFPQMRELWHRLGGTQVRNTGTIGGNIANGSPIGDTPPALIALGASIVLRKGQERRTLNLEDFFLSYGKQDRAPGEFVETVFIPDVPEGAQFAVYKISKRFEEDISALCGAFNITVSDGVVETARIAFGGMAAIPKRAKAVEQALIGQPWSEATVEAALPAFAEDFSPLTDMRASKEYRLLSAQNLLRRFFYESQGSQDVRLERGVA